MKIFSFFRRALSFTLPILLTFSSVFGPFISSVEEVFAAPTLSISQVLAAGTSNPLQTGQEFDYEVTWGCLGAVSPADDCNNLQITGTLPASLQYVSAVFSSPVTGVSVVGNNITVNFTPVVTAGSIGSFTLRARFPAGTTPTGVVADMTLSISADTVAPVVSAPVSITSLATDNLTITKTNISNTAPDNLSSYLLQVCPNGGQLPSGAGYLLPTNLSIVDILPPGAVYFSSNKTPTSVVGNVVTWNEPGLSTISTSSPNWDYGCFSYEITVNFPSSDPSNVPGAVKVNTGQAQYTPTGGVATTKSSITTQTLPSPVDGVGILSKTANTTGYVGEEYRANFTQSNTGTTTLNYEIIDVIPSEVALDWFSVSSSISAVEYQKNGVNTWITGVSFVGPYQSYVNATNFPGFTSGDYVSALKIKYDNINPGGDINTTIAATYINPGNSGGLYTLPHSFTNTATSNTYSITGVLIHSQNDDAITNIIPVPRKFNPGTLKCVATASGSCLSSQTYAPGNTGYYALTFFNDRAGITLSEQVSIMNPTYVDLLPAEIELINLPSQFVYTYEGTITGRDPLNNDCKPDVTVIPNFEGSNRTMLVFSWAGKTPICEIGRDSGIKVSNLQFRVKSGTAPGTISNRATAINSENLVGDIIYGIDESRVCDLSTNSGTYLDDNIILGASGGLIDGKTVNSSYLCLSTDPPFYPGRTFTVANSFQMESQKCVRGQLDSGEYCSGDSRVATTIRGGDMTWTNKITNVGNISVTNMEMIDILPFPGNVGVGNPVNLGSTWQPQFFTGLTLSGAPSGTTVYYSTEANPCRASIVAVPGCTPMTTITGVAPGAGEWSDILPSNPLTVRSLRIDFGSNIIAGGQSIAVSYDMTAPSNAPLATDGLDGISANSDDTDIAWNSFGWSTTRMSDSTVQSSAPTRVGIEVRTSSGFKLGDFAWNDTNTNGQQDDGPTTGLNNIRVDLYSDTDGDVSTSSDQTLIGTQFTTHDPVTTHSGYYLFEGLSTGNYFVRFFTPTSHPFASTANSGNDTSDSDGLSLSGQAYTQTPVYNLIADNLTVDQGFSLTMSASPSTTPPVSTPTVGPVTGPGGGGGGGSVSSANTTPQGLRVNQTNQNPVSITTSKKISSLVKKESFVKDVVNDFLLGSDELRFILPKKLFDTGTSLAKKGVKIYRDPRVATEPQTFFEPYNRIEDAPIELSSYVGGLPRGDRSLDSYVVIPTTGIIAPIRDMPEGSDRRSVIVGKEIPINPYLQHGVLQYPNSAPAGQLGNMVISGHSSYWNWDSAGRYKTVFGSLPTVDTGEEVWVYKRGLDPTTKKYTYTRYRYNITASYNTNPYDVGVLVPEKGKKLITLFTCTPIGGLSGRWIVRGELME